MTIEVKPETGHRCLAPACVWTGKGIIQGRSSCERLSHRSQSHFRVCPAQAELNLRVVHWLETTDPESLFASVL